MVALGGLSESMIREIEHLEGDIEILQERIAEASDEKKSEHGNEISEGWDNVSDDINSLTEMRMNFRHGISDEVKEDQLKQTEGTHFRRHILSRDS